MRPDLLIDTCVAIWLAEGRTLSPPATKALNDRFDGQGTVMISAVTAWEFGMLQARGRMRWPMGALTAFRSLADLPSTRIADLTPEILVESSLLPGSPHGDPFDRILMATARLLDLTLLTGDRLILAYAAAGHVAALPCSSLRS